MKLFFKYLREKLSTIAFFLLIITIFTSIMVLYRFTAAAILYPLVLCTVFGTAVLILDFIKIKKLHDRLETIKGSVSSLPRDIPSDGSITSCDLCEIITALDARAAQMTAENSASYCDIVDYYTVWAHQIKTPIAAMKLSLQGEDSTLSRRLKSDLFRIEQYVGMVLMYLRLGPGAGDFVFRSCKLDNLIRPPLRKFAPEFIGKKLKLDYEPTDIHVITDEKWFSFVIEQVLSNALKYTREGSIRIYTEGGSTLCIADTGIGIASEDLPRIFEKGYTGNNGRIEKSATGIGLYLCRRVCDNLGLTISARSEVGRGTVISIGLSNGSSIHE